MSRRTTNNDVWCVVVAAGRGERFGRLKQFERFRGRRLVDHAVAAVTAWGPTVVALPGGHTWDGTPVEHVVTGGVTRADSVRAALAVIPGDARIVVVHDAAHPLAAPELIAAVVEAVEQGADGAVPVIPVLDTVGFATDGVLTDALTKAAMVSFQMPQAFSASSLRRAHASRVVAEDDPSLLVRLGAHVRTVAGDPTNVHVASPVDLALAERLALDR